MCKKARYINSHGSLLLLMVVIHDDMKHHFSSLPHVWGEECNGMRHWLLENLTGEVDPDFRFQSSNADVMPIFLAAHQGMV